MIASLIRIVCEILILALVARAILSWIMHSGNKYNQGLAKAYTFLGLITEPLVSPVRKLLSKFISTGPLDFAPIVTMFLIIIVQNILLRILI